MQRVGFVGLGIMGSGMARNLAKKGLEVTVWNRTPARAAALAGEPGVEVAIAANLRALAESVEIVCTCVADPAALDAVFDAEAGLFSAAREGQLFIDFSTVSPEQSQRLCAAARARGADYVEAPVTGSKGGAEKGTLLVMAGGSLEALARAKPVFDAVSEKVIRCGDVGSASQVKLAGNALIALMLQGLSEGMLLTKSAGVDPRVLLEVIQASGFRSPYFDFKGKALLERNFETQFSIDLMFKDLSLFLDSAARHRTPTPAVSAVREAYQLARAHGKGDLDITAVVTALEDLSGRRIS